MEDVQQRRQRLAAMREQASLEDGSDATASKTAPATFPGSLLSLPNPMIDAPPVTGTGTNRASGFDFYTDPLTAFTGAKRRKPAVGGGVLGGAPPFGPGGMQAPHWQPAPRTPPVFLHPSMHPPPPPHSGHGWQPTPYQPPLGAPGPPLSYNLGQPQSFSNQSHGRGMEMGSGGRGRGMYSSPEGRGAYANDFSGQGRGYSNNNRWNSGGRASVAGGFVGRGGLARASQGRGGQRGGRTPSAKDQPHLFYKKSMVEDPWKELEAKLKGVQRTN